MTLLRAFFARFLVFFSLTLVSLCSMGARINFEDAHQVLGHGGDPASFYQGDGLTFSGDYFGIIEGVTNGDSGNFMLEGSNGAASLAVNEYGESIVLSFDHELSFLCFDIGGSWSAQLENAEYVFPRLQLTVYIGTTPIHTEEVTLEDNRRDGRGIWRTYSFSAVDEVSLEVLGSGYPDWPVWAIDNIRFDEECGVFVPPMDDQVLIKTGSRLLFIQFPDVDS